MKNKLMGVLAIVGIVMLVGCGGGSDGSSDTSSDTSSPDTSSPDTSSSDTSSSDTSSSDTSSSNEDILIMTKQSNTSFTIEWDKNYIVASDGDSSFGHSSIGYVEYNKDPDSIEQATQAVAQGLTKSKHQITCSLHMDEDINGKAVFRCDNIMTYDDGVPHESTSYIRIKPDLTYYFGKRYRTLDPQDIGEWQGPDYEFLYTSDGTLTIE